MTDRTPRSLSRQLTRSTGIQLILVASAIGILTYSLGRTVACSAASTIAQHSRWCASLKNSAAN